MYNKDIILYIKEIYVIKLLYLKVRPILFSLKNDSIKTCTQKKVSFYYFYTH